MITKTEYKVKTIHLMEGRTQIFQITATDPDHACHRFSSIMPSWRVVKILRVLEKDRT